MFVIGMMKGVAVQKLLSLFVYRDKAEKRQRFEVWRMRMLSGKSSVEVLASTRWVREEMEEYESNDSSNANAASKDMSVRKAVAALYRYKARRLASSYWHWKYFCQFGRL